MVLSKMWLENSYVAKNIGLALSDGARSAKTPNMNPCGPHSTRTGPESLGVRQGIYIFTGSPNDDSPFQKFLKVLKETRTALYQNMAPTPHPFTHPPKLRQWDPCQPKMLPFCAKPAKLYHAGG